MRRLVVIALFASACSSSVHSQSATAPAPAKPKQAPKPLEPEYTKLVELAGDAQAIAGCKFLGLVTDQAGGNFHSFDQNVQLLVAELQKDTYELGGSHVMIGEPIPLHDVPWSFTFGRCVNCVRLSGKAYKCRSVANAAPASEVPVDSNPDPRCAATCKTRGECVWIGAGKCAPASDADCGRSDDCANEARCRQCGRTCCP